MPLLAIGLVLASCVLHAYWNLLFKRAGDKLAFTALFLLVAPVVSLPMFVWLLPRHPVPAAGWACIGITGALYFVYFVALAWAYRDGELSVAYPLARGIGPALTLG